jgi:putative copper export protein
MKALFLLGVLVVVGAAFFTVVVLQPLGLERSVARRQADLLFVGFLAALSGSEALLQTVDAGGTRFAQALGLAAGASAVGAVAALLTPAYARVRFVAWLAAAVLVVCPTLAGHAFDPGSSRPLSVLSDIVHLGAAAVWVGGLASLVYTLGRADPEVSRHAARRFAAFALLAALLVLASGPLRALTAFSSLGQLWSTDYGRTLLVKVAVVVPLLVLAWLNRSRLIGAFARLRRVAIVELFLLSAVVVAVSVLTELPPGRADIELAGVSLTPAALAEAPVPPPRRAFVDARRAGDLTVGFALRGRDATVTLVGADGKAAEGVDVAIDGPPAQSCGPGCFSARVTGRSVVVRVDRRNLRFEAPARLSPAGDLLGRAASVFGRLASVTVDERSADSNGTRRSRIVFLAPDRSSTMIVAGSDVSSIGSRTVVIGGRRWQRGPAGRWRTSEQPAASVPRPPWSSASRNAYYDGNRTITFFDPAATAWYRLELDPGSARPRRLVLIAPGRIVSDRYSQFDRPVRIVRPAA